MRVRYGAVVLQTQVIKEILGETSLAGNVASSLVFVCSCL